MHERGYCAALGTKCEVQFSAGACTIELLESPGSGKLTIVECDDARGRPGCTIYY